MRAGLVAHPQQHQRRAVRAHLVEDVRLDEALGLEREVGHRALVGVVLDDGADPVDERLREVRVGLEVLAGDAGARLGVDVLVDLELRDVVEQRRHPDHVDVGALALGDPAGELDDVQDVVEPVVRAVPGVPPHPAAVLLVGDARGEVLADELLHPRVVVLGDGGLADLDAHG